MHQKASKYYLAQTRPLFYCHIKIKIPAVYGALLLEKCFSLMEQINKQYNSYTPGSYFDQINQNAGHWTDADGVTLKLVDATQRIKLLTGGAYNIAVMPLLRLWGFYTEGEGRLPKEEEIERVTASLRTQAIETADHKVKLPEGQQIVTGSFLKAFAVDQVLHFLKNEGVHDAIINAGGSTIACLNDEEHPYWNINIPHPSAPVPAWQQIQLSNAAFSLSGRREHFVSINGKHYGHILNARTGHPSANWQAAVLTHHAMESDMLSTALFAMNAQERATVLPGLKAHYSPFQHYVIEENGTEELPAFFHLNSEAHAVYTRP